MDISVVLSTYNRCDILPRALHCLAHQQASDIEYEIVVVDNNSTDQTKAVVESFTAKDKRFRYIFEGRQGLSHGRNAGIHAARAEVLAFTDDDVEVARDWIAQMYRATLRYPRAEYFGGRVLPVIGAALPDWAHAKMAPFALQDLGDEPIAIDRRDGRCLIGACLAVRRRAFVRCGLFSIATQRVKEGVGSTEDADWESEVWNRGGHGMYVPEVVVHSPLCKERLTKLYHRRWHMGHGKFNARVRRPELEGARRVLHVPAFIYRQMIQNALGFTTSFLRFKKIEAFEYENAFLFALGFIAERWKSQLMHSQPASSPASEPGMHAAAVNSLAS